MLTMLYHSTFYLWLLSSNTNTFNCSCGIVFFQTMLYSQEIGYELMIPMLEFFSIVLCHEIETVLHYVCVHSIKVDLKVTGHI